MDGSKVIYIFYHMFLINDWERIFRYHFHSMMGQGLYDKCEKIYIGVIYKNKKELELLEKYITYLDRYEILYTRKYTSLPVKIWKDKKVNAQLGEGETILKMTEFAQDKREDVYLFMHTKGVTKPSYKKRIEFMPMSDFYKKGLVKNPTDEEIEEFLLKDMCKEVVENWEENIKSFNEFYHYYANFFWISGDLLRTFDFEKFRKYRKKDPEKKRRITNRHWTSRFPIWLYGMNNNIIYHFYKTTNPYGYKI